MFRRHLKELAVVLPTVVAGGYVLWKLSHCIKNIIDKTKLKTGRFPKEIHIVTTAAEWELIYPTIIEHTSKIKVLGLDAEWVMNREEGISHPVALLQLATYQGVCVLIRLCQLSPEIPKSLLKLLSDKSIIKVGVAVKDDGKKLFKDHRITVQGCVDLRHILSRVRGHYHCVSKGLKGLAEGVLGFSLQKDSVIRCGDWEAKVMSDKQIEYAALDALVGIDIYIKLVITKHLGYIPTHKQLETQAVCQCDFSRISSSLCQGLVDTNFKRTADDEAGSKPMGNGGKNKKSKVDMVRSYSTRQHPLYHNCHLEAPDGQMLCTCDQSKAEWYLNKGLGIKIRDDPLTVRLNFEPSGRPQGKENYYLQYKDNVCVVCGRSESYIRKFIVPQEYRKYFPYIMKAHTSHDVLLLCPPCHQISSQNDADFRLDLASECDAPLDSGSCSKSTQDQTLQKIKAAAKALLYSRDKLPEERRQELEDKVRSHLGFEELTEDRLLQTINMDIRVYNSSYVSHAEKVVQYMKENGGLLAFERRWRKHFVDKMKPEYLPPLWSIDHTHQQVAKLGHVDF